jgi:hypothetical protein
VLGEGVEGNELLWNEVVWNEEKELVGVEGKEMLERGI